MGIGPIRGITSLTFILSWFYDMALRNAKKILKETENAVAYEVFAKYTT